MVRWQNNSAPFEQEKFRVRNYYCITFICYRNVCGLCGNFNGLHQDDFLPRFSTNITVNTDAFVQSWQSDDTTCSTDHINTEIDKSSTKIAKTSNKMWVILKFINHIILDALVFYQKVIKRKDENTPKTARKSKKVYF